MTFNILLLEDEQYRIDWFKKKFRGCNIIQTANPKIAISILENNSFDYIFLDHDLLPEHENKDIICDQTTGLCVSKWLNENQYNNPQATIVIHSLNPSGSLRMFNSIDINKRKVEKIPYHLLDNRIKFNNDE